MWVTGVQTCALPICASLDRSIELFSSPTGLGSPYGGSGREQAGRHGRRSLTGEGHGKMDLFPHKGFLFDVSECFYLGNLEQFLYASQIPTVDGLPSLVFFHFNIGEDISVSISNCDPFNELF